MTIMISQIIVRAGAVLLSLGLLVGIGGCSARQVASTSGDQSLTTRAQAATETVQEEAIGPMKTRPPSEETQSPSAGISGGSQPTPSAPGSGSVASRSAAPGGDMAGGSMVPGSKKTTSPTDVTALGDIYYDFDRYSIRKDALPVLEGDAKWLRNEAGKSIVIEGHCDERGTFAYNLVLGEKRAKAAERYLEDLGIPPSRMQTTSYGELRPFCNDHNEGCWQQNRRAHFVVQ